MRVLQGSYQTLPAPPAPYPLIEPLWFLNPEPATLNRGTYSLIRGRGGGLGSKGFGPSAIALNLHQLKSGIGLAHASEAFGLGFRV